MGTIVEATVPTEQFALRETFEAVPDARFDAVRVVAHEVGQVMPFLWSSAPDPDALEEALKADSTTKNVRQLASEQGQRLYQMQWRANIRVIVHILVDEHGVLLGASGRKDRWNLRVLFPDHDSLSAAYDVCREHGINLAIRRVNGMADSITREGIGLSEEQHEALTAALNAGYYGVPRGVTLEELAEQLEVSHQALSERLRRGYRNLIANTLADSTRPIERKL